MGNKSSSEGSWPQASTTQSSSSSGWKHDYSQATVSQYAQSYPKPNQPSTTGSSSSSGWQNGGINTESSSSQYDDQNPPIAYPYQAPAPAPAPAGYPQKPPVAYPYPAAAGYPPVDQFNARPQDYASPSPVPASYHMPTSQVHVPNKRFDKRYSRIADNYHSLEEVRVVFCGGRPQNWWFHQISRVICLNTVFIFEMNWPDEKFEGSYLPETVEV